MNKTIIIAEAGVNHNGSIDTAKQLVNVAVDAGVDYIKFQTFKARNLVSANAAKAEYQKQNTQNADETQLAMLKQLELSYEEQLALVDYCKARHIKFFSTAFDLESIDFLASLHLDLWKIPSGEITNYPYIRKIAQHGQPVILSTGMCEMKEIADAVRVLKEFGLTKEKITILHCNTEYPTPMSDVNLRAMNDIKDTFGVEVGYSDHTMGIEVPIAAVAMGATVIEKHFTLDRTMNGPDHKASLEPNELKDMVAAIRNIELALGSNHKHVTASEQKNIAIARKSIVAATNIRKGELFTENNLTVKRPGTGITPMRWNEVIGLMATKDYQSDDLIEL